MFYSKRLFFDNSLLHIYIFTKFEFKSDYQLSNSRKLLDPLTISGRNLWKEKFFDKPNSSKLVMITSQTYVILKRRNLKSILITATNNVKEVITSTIGIRFLHPWRFNNGPSSSRGEEAWIPSIGLSIIRVAISARKHGSAEKWDDKERW